MTILRVLLPVQVQKGRAALTACHSSLTDQLRILWSGDIEHVDAYTQTTHKHYISHFLLI